MLMVLSFDLVLSVDIAYTNPTLQRYNLQTEKQKISFRKIDFDESGCFLRYSESYLPALNAGNILLKYCSRDSPVFIGKMPCSAVRMSSMVKKELPCSSFTKLSTLPISLRLATTSNIFTGL